MSTDPRAGRGAATAAGILALLAVPPLLLAALLIQALASWGEEGGTGWVFVPLVAAGLLVVGVVQLLRGRSWILHAVAVTASALLAGWAFVGAMIGGGGLTIATLIVGTTLVVLLVSLVLAASPDVRARIAARRGAPHPAGHPGERGHVEGSDR